jgi:outer membrane protein assembly factor BamB
LDTSFKVNTLTIDAAETVLYLGTNSGQLLCMDPGDMSIIGQVQSNVGDIYALATHPTKPLVATMGMDNFACLWNVERPERPELIDRFNLRHVTPWNDMETINRHRASQSQALCFHPTLARLATRNASSAVVELDYTDGKLKLIHCTRMHELEDVTTVRYVQDEGIHLLSAALGSVVLSENGMVLKNWRMAEKNIHWFEPLGKDVYLVATDDRRVLRFDLARGEVAVRGPVITRDDLEHVTFNRVSGRAYIAGFDRNVYEIDPDTCESKGVVCRIPFKMRWIKTLRRAPDVAFVQCFDGGVYKLDLAAGRVSEVARSTPPAVWAACHVGERLLLTGEGDELVSLGYAAPDQARLPRFQVLGNTPKHDAQTYTKRMIAGADGTAWLAQTSGKLLRYKNNECQLLVDLQAPVRDLALDLTGTRVLVCLEDGNFHSIDARSGAIRASWTSSKGLPIWTLAVHPENGAVAIGELNGNFHFLDAHTAGPRDIGPQCGRTKRAQWLDKDTLLYTRADAMYRYQCSTRENTLMVQPCGNTVEDFIWNSTFGYLVLITYGTDLVLCDLATGEKLEVCADQMDYSKGLIWLKRPGDHHYPLDFVTYGRSGTAHMFRIHSNKCVALGPIMPKILNEYYELDGSTGNYLKPCQKMNMAEKGA